MIEEIKIGNILKSKAQTLVNTVNTVGVMGKGIALEFKKAFPDMYKDYKIRCAQGKIDIGKPYIFKRMFKPDIINFPTKKHWRAVSKVKDIEVGLKYLVDHYKEWGIKSLAIPPLGCGNGQLEWGEVGPIIYQSLNPIDIPVELYAPYGTSPRLLSIEYLRNYKKSTPRKIKIINHKLNPSWLVLVEILNELEKQPYSNHVGRTIFQKLCYVATEEGVPTNFNFSQKSYGPFSSDVKKAISILANHGIIEEQQRGQMIRIKVGPVFEKYREKYFQFISKYKKIIGHISDLFARMNTDQAEITTTIMYSVKDLKKKTNWKKIDEKEVFDYVMNWKKRRKPPLNKEEIASSIRNLAILNWLDVSYSKDLPIREEF